MAMRTVSVGAASTLVAPTPYPSRRRKITFVNDSANVMYICQGSFAAVNTGIRLAAYASAFDQPDPTGFMWQGDYTAYCGAGASDLLVLEEFQER